MYLCLMRRLRNSATFFAVLGSWFGFHSCTGSSSAFGSFDQEKHEKICQRDAICAASSKKLYIVDVTCLLFACSYSSSASSLHSLCLLRLLFLLRRCMRLSDTYETFSTGWRICKTFQRGLGIPMPTLCMYTATTADYAVLRITLLAVRYCCCLPLHALPHFGSAHISLAQTFFSGAFACTIVHLYTDFKNFIFRVIS